MRYVYNMFLILMCFAAGYVINLWYGHIWAIFTTIVVAFLLNEAN